MNPSSIVSIASDQELRAYPTQSPFLPDEAYAELRGWVNVGKDSNITYILFRELMREMGMDIGHFSTPEWNPFSEIIHPGQKVLVKPNLVRHIHLGGGDYNAVVTHGSLVRCVLDYVALALKGRGEITVGDAPVQSADWSRILERTGLKKVCEDISKAWKIPVRLIDFRLWAVQLDDHHCIVEGNVLKGDPRGYVAVDLGKRSLLAPLDHLSEKFRVTSYDCRQMREHHNSQKHEYLIPKSVLDADVVINLPKLKTHRKVGLTASLKNIVGINGHKDWLPHHRCGSVAEGGDEYRERSFFKRLQTRLGEKTDQDSQNSRNSFKRLMIRITDRLARSMAPDPFFEGSWYGNDTLWRTVLDLNRLLVYADKDGKMTEAPQRKCMTIVDAIIAGEGEGPMEPDGRPLGMLAGGINPVALDAVLATIIGFNYKKIPIIAKAFDVGDWPLVDFGPDEVEIRPKDNRWVSLRLGDASKELCFKPSAGWYGHIES